MLGTPPFPGCCAARRSLRRGALLVRGPLCLASEWVPALRSSARGAASCPGHERNLLAPPPSDLPVGRVVDMRVHPPLQKYFTSPVGQIISTSLRHPTPQRGAYHDRQLRGVGCGGRGSVLRATGLQGRSMRFVSDQQHADERRCCVRRSRVVLTLRRWCQVRGV